MPRPDRALRCVKAKEELDAFLSDWQRRHGLSNNEYTALVVGELAIHTIILVDQDRDQENLRKRKKDEG